MIPRQHVQVEYDPRIDPSNREQYKQKIYRVTYVPVIEGMGSKEVLPLPVSSKRDISKKRREVVVVGLIVALSLFNVYLRYL